MAPRKKKPDDPPPAAPKSGDRHKPRRMVGIRVRLAAQADILAARNETDLTEVANTALRELLEREGLWPPPADA